jgi:hypothetical protein
MRQSKIMSLCLCFLFAISPLFIFSNEMLKFNIDQMNTSPLKSTGMDIVIICASNKATADFWEQRMEQTRQYLLPPETLVICVDEDWSGEGAGNGLGTLYAYQKALLKAKEKYGIDVLQQQAERAAIAMYHTAGFGKRLAPLTITENGIKSAVKLPGFIHPVLAGSDETPPLMTLLEATIKQSQIYGASRKGRLSVFWSDQVFIPSNSCNYTPDSHIDILVKMVPFPTQENWEKQHLENYGLVAWNASGSAKLFDKCSYTTFQGILADNKALAQKGLAISMGTFSLSTPMLIALLNEFERELKEKTVLLDSDPYFWMPMTLDLETYYSAMKARKVSSEVIKNHYDRMQNLKSKFSEQFPEKALFSAVDIGSKSYWWDYGTVDSYFKNNIIMTQNCKESTLMRKFFNINATQDDALVIGSHILKRQLENSIVIGVEAENIILKDSIMIGCSVKSFEGQKVLAYHIHENETITLGPENVRADAFIQEPCQHLKFIAPLSSDGKSNWKIKLPHNHYSWEEAIKLTSKKT